MCVFGSRGRGFPLCPCVSGIRTGARALLIREERAVCARMRSKRNWTAMITKRCVDVDVYR